MALVKYYEGHPASAETMAALKRSMQRAIDDLGAIQASERADFHEIRDPLSEMDAGELDWKNR